MACSFLVTTILLSIAVNNAWSGCLKTAEQNFSSNAASKPDPHRLLEKTETLTSEAMTTTEETTVTRQMSPNENVRTIRASHPSQYFRECGRSKVPSMRIVGGTEASIGAWPWMCALYVKNSFEDDYDFPDCGGALVSDKHIITAAHCVTDLKNNKLNTSLLVARLGEHNVCREDEATPIDCEVASVEKHYAYDPATFSHDIAIVTLKKPVIFSAAIQPVCFLPSSGCHKTEPLAAWVVGWGSLYYNGPSSCPLMEITVRSTDINACAETYEKEKIPIRDGSYLCAAARGKDGCQGDSGGPMMYLGKEHRYCLIGLVSFGMGCADAGYPGVYTKVATFISWIEERVVINV